MPKLRRSEADGHYYTRVFVHAAGGVATWRISEGGLAVLCSYGIAVGDEIPRSIFSDLVRRGLAYTGGTGIAPVDSAPLTPPDFARPQLGVEVSETSWSLSILFPEAPADWAADPTLLSRCTFRVGDTSLPAIRLWPGKGGASITVSPQEQAYVVVADGQWPVDWDLGAWATEIPGLCADGTLFSRDEGGLRLCTGEGLIPGNSYRLVARIDTHRASAAFSALLPPLPTRTVELDTIGAWHAWEFQLPETANDQFREWARHLGHLLAEFPGRLALLSPPPHSYSIHQLPYIEAGQTALIRISLPQNAGWTRRPSELVLLYSDGTRELKPIARLDCVPSIGHIQYLTLEVKQAGTYRLQAARGYFVPLTFLVIEQQLKRNTSSHRLALEVTVKCGEESWQLHALA